MKPRVKLSVCRKEQGIAEAGNTCLQTPGTCESCPNWWKKSRANKKANAELHKYFDLGVANGLRLAGVVLGRTHDLVAGKLVKRRQKRFRGV